MADWTIIRRYGDTDFITGLRAIAATMVVMFHTSLFREFGAIGVNLTEAGRYGVQVFFVISGFTIATTFLGADSYRSYLIRRLMRIAPLYVFIIVVAVLLTLAEVINPVGWSVRFGVDIDAYNLLMHLSFLSFLDYRIANSLVGVEWTIPVEVFWYVVLPWIISRLAGTRAAIILMTVLLTMAFVTVLAGNKLGSPLISEWFPSTYGPYFLLGVLAYKARPTEMVKGCEATIFWGGAALFAFAALAAPIMTGAWVGLAVALMVVGHREGRVGALTTTPLLLLGSISYSIYLWHALVIRFFAMPVDVPGYVEFAAVYGLTILLSVATYLLVEKPTNNLGARLARH